MKTRRQYMQGECTHREYYAQFVNEQTKQKVLASIGLKRLLNSRDENLNDIQLKYWDSILCSSYQSAQMKECGDWLSPAGQVCINKEAARQIIEGEV